MAVTPKPTPPKPEKKKKKSKGRSSKGFSTQDLTNYLLLGGSLSDISGNKITQGQVLSALSDPKALKVILDSLSTSFGGTGEYDPSRDYSQDVPTFEATYNPVVSKYANLSGPQAALVTDFFESIDSGVDPAVAASKLFDKNFISQYGLDSSNANTASFLAKLADDAPKYAKAETTRQSAIQKQNYEAWRKGVMSKGATPSEYIAKALGIPALANLPDPTRPFETSQEELATSGDVAQLLGRFNPALARTGYEPTAADKLAAKKYASQFQGPRGDVTAQGIDEFFGAKGQSPRQYIPESWFGAKQSGTRAINETLGTALAGGMRLLGGIVTLGGFNPFSKAVTKEGAQAGDEAVRQAAYQEFLSRTTGALNQQMASNTRERILRLAARKINERGTALQQQGITPFSQQLAAVQSILGGSKLPIVKSK